MYLTSRNILIKWRFLSLCDKITSVLTRSYSACSQKLFKQTSLCLQFSFIASGVGSEKKCTFFKAEKCVSIQNPFIIRLMSQRVLHMFAAFQVNAEENVSVELHKEEKYVWAGHIVLLPHFGAFMFCYVTFTRMYMK